MKSNNNLINSNKKVNSNRLNKHSSHSGINYEIIVVDNASTDGSVDMIKKIQRKVQRYKGTKIQSFSSNIRHQTSPVSPPTNRGRTNLKLPRSRLRQTEGGQTSNISLKLIINKQNLGFAKAVNQAFELAQGDVLLLNPDCVVQKGAVEALREFSAGHPEAGVIGGRLLDPDGSVQGSVFRLPTVWRAFRQVLGFSERVGEKFAPVGKHPVEVEAVSGAAIWLPERTRRRVGSLDERYFMYFEDLDYCRRVRQAGLKVYYHPGAAFVHFHGQSGKNLGSRTGEWLVKSAQRYHGRLGYRLITLLLKLDHYKKKDSSKGMIRFKRFLPIGIILLAAILRLYRLGSVPPALFGDEVDTGYQAYSLINTGRDYFGNLFPVHFESIGDWRVPLYIYLIAPVVGLFGLTAWTVRLPAALFGTLAVLVTYFFTRELFHQTSSITPQTSSAPRSKSKTSGVDHTSSPGWRPGVTPGLSRLWRGFTPGVGSSRSETSPKKAISSLEIGNCPPSAKTGRGKLEIAELSALLLAVSPWHIHLSRGAFEAILVTLLFPLGLLFLKRGLEGGRLTYWLAAAVCWGLTPYAYNTPKLFLPLSLALFTGIFAKHLLFRKRRFLIFLAVLAIVLLPQAKDLVSGPGVARFQAINLFTNPEVSERVRLARASGGQFIVFEIMLHNKATYWLRDFTENYLRSFSPEFLFLTGDPNPRHSLPGRGQLYLMELPFLLVGLYFLLATWIKKRNPWLLFLIGWFFIASVPAALTQGGGNHAIRLIHFLPVIQIIVAVGFIGHTTAISKSAKKLLLSGSGVILGISLLTYLHSYFVHYPKTAASWWNYGYREVFAYLKENESRFSKIYLSSSREPSLVHAFFHGCLSPDLVQAEITQTTEVVGKYHFLSPDITELGRRGPEPGTLYVLNTGELANMNLKIDGNPRFCKIADVYDPGGDRLKIIFTHPNSCP